MNPTLPNKIILNLLKQLAFLDDIVDGLHLHAFGLVDVLERKDFLCSFMLDYADLNQQKST